MALARRLAALLLLLPAGALRAQHCEPAALPRDSVTLTFQFVPPLTDPDSTLRPAYLELAEMLRARLPMPMLASMARWPHTLFQRGSPLGSDTPLRIEGQIQFRLDSEGHLVPDTFGSSTAVPPLDDELRQGVQAANRAGDFARLPESLRRLKRPLALSIAVTTGEAAPQSVIFATWRTDAVMIDEAPIKIVAPAPGVLPSYLQKSDAAVGVTFLIDTAGAVIPGSSRIVYSGFGELNPWALGVVEQTRFTPAMTHGCPVLVEMATRFAMKKGAK